MSGLSAVVRRLPLMHIGLFLILLGLALLLLTVYNSIGVALIVVGVVFLAIPYVRQRNP